MSDDVTRAVYDAEAARYAEMMDDYNRTDPLLAAFMGVVPAGGRVLDLGCGPGAAAEEMARAGFRVDAMDASREMVAMAGARAGVTAILGTFDDLVGEDVYDGVWANFSLLHAARADMPRHLSAIRRMVVPGGAFHIAVKSGDGAARDKLGRFYTYYQEGELTGLLKAAGLVPRTHNSGSGTGLDGSESPWISALCHG